MEPPVLPFGARALNVVGRGARALGLPMGRLDVDEMLQRVNPPVLLMKAIADFHPELGLMGAMSEEDLEEVSRVAKGLFTYLLFREDDKGGQGGGGGRQR